MVKRLRSNSGTRLPRGSLWTNAWAVKGRALISVTISSNSLPMKAKGDSLMLSGGSTDGCHGGFKVACLTFLVHRLELSLGGVYIVWIQCCAAGFGGDGDDIFLDISMP